MPCQQLSDNIVVSTMEGKLADITVAETSRHAEEAPTRPSQVVEANAERASESPLVEAPTSEVSASSASAAATSVEPATAATEPAKSGLAAATEQTSAVSQAETSRNAEATQSLAACPKREQPETSDSSRKGSGIQEPVPHMDLLNEQPIENEADERNEAQESFRRTSFSGQEIYQLDEHGATAIKEAARVVCTDIINAQYINYSPYQVVYEQQDLTWTLSANYLHDNGVIYEKIQDEEHATILTGTEANEKIVSGIGRLDVSTFKVTRTYLKEDEEYYCDTVGTYRDRHGGAHPMQVNIAFRGTTWAMAHWPVRLYNLQISGLQLIHTPSKSTARKYCAGDCCFCNIL